MFAKAAARIALAVIGLTFLTGSTYMTLIYLETHLRGLGFDTATTNVSLAQVGYLAAAMTIGLTASHVFQRASAVPDHKFHIGRTIRDMPARGRFWMALAVSPLVFHTVLLGVGDTELTFAHYLLAFQNGFFWETVIGRPSDLQADPQPATGVSSESPTPHSGAQP